MIHLDTSFLVQGLAGIPATDKAIRSWLASGETIAISCLAWTEFLCGPLESADRVTAERLLPNPVPFLLEDAQLAATLFNSSGRRRGTLIDCMIAAIAIRSEAVLATGNTRDFVRFETAGLRLATT